MHNVIGLRIDVDTVKGYKNGVIPLLNLLARYNIKASFFIITGYDSPIRTLPRFFNERGFFKRVFRLRGSLCYKMLSLTRLTFKECIKQIKDKGHEIGLHGYHHFDWQLRLRDWSTRRINKDLCQAIEYFKLHTGLYPHSFAAPGWVTKKEVFLAEENFHFDYCSDTRGISPFYPLIGNKTVETLQVPVTLPTLDELISLGNPNRLIDINIKGNEVYCAHAEFDGMKYISIFEAFLENNLKKGYRFIRLSEMKSHFIKILSSRVIYKTIPGRTNIVAYQGEPDV
ncbi:polysaccharide deacetylase family protein [candidate division WOR-3 bacterium]|nr:polysaccharide deacetylase family protein [candidate division WOR-3 bacterium]